MGREAQIQFRIDGQAFEGKALLESGELILRGVAPSRRLAWGQLQELVLVGTSLCFRHGAQRLELDLGPDEASKWLKKIQAGPPSLASKLGISGAKPAAVFGPVEEDASLASALAGAYTESATQAAALLALVQSQQALDQALALHATMPCRALWLVFEKGPKAVFGEGLIRSYVRSLGYRDNKSCAVSDRITATRYLKP